MKPQSAKQKGRKLQQYVRDKILKIFPQLTSDDVRSTGMGQGGVDVQLSSQAKALFPFSVECKNKEKISIWAELEQAEKNCEPNTSALLVIKRNRSKVYAVLELDHLIEVLNEKKETD